MLGLWIDSLTEEQKDRIVEGQGWKNGFLITPDGSRCLVGHVAEGLEKYVGEPIGEAVALKEGWSRCMSFGAPHILYQIEVGFDKLFLRHGDRLVRAIKARAAATMSSHVERAIEREEHVTCTV